MCISLCRWTPGQSPDYTQQQAQQVLEQNPAEDNAALVRLAERLIRQQDAGVGKPQAIRAALPAQGRQLIFTGSLQVQSWADLRVKLDVRETHPAGGATRCLTLIVVLVALVLLGLLSRRPR